ncbi:hypothetical protein [Pseudonocardia broussonetiae]|uniref:Uncharacterized protein n=1 Tax=Pseudonocardia broussonetiae TaxID=2736640 RepID=A0A6M6JFT5_9PSEU|nr:hypothetical protein [Pseudonocardia broussonetiae]QJY45777.1 hypothetical protein HOP40_08185 [Pseudonocardia broussonetiae]
MADMPVAVTVSGRERALLRAVDAGRCQFRGGCEPVLLVDGLACADSSVARRLVDLGLVAAPDTSVPVQPATATDAGRALLTTG